MDYKKWEKQDNEKRETAFRELMELVDSNESGRDALIDVLDAYFVNNEGGYEAAKGIMSTIGLCGTDDLRRVADFMLINIFGWSVETIVNDLKHELRENYNVNIDYDKERPSGLVDTCSLYHSDLQPSPAPEKIVVPVAGGILEAEASADPENPGISICFISDKHPDALFDVCYVENTSPELLPAHVAKRDGAIRILSYGDPWTEDYTHDCTIYAEDVDKVCEDIADTKRIATDIIWDTDGDEDALASLPREIAIPDQIANEYIGDYLSDLTGFCHKGFVVKEVK